MISLFITLFICLFSVCPTNTQVVDHTENNVKRSIDYWEDSGGSLFVSSGYTTSYQELACSEIWLKIEETFSNVWSTFTDDYGDFYNYQVIPCSGLYMQIPLYYSSNPSYYDNASYVSTNYDDYKVTSMVIYNRMYSPWSPNVDFNTKYFYAHSMDFRLNTHYILVMWFLKADNGANQSTYSIECSLYDTNTAITTPVDIKNLSLFATNTFTYTDTFFVSDYWLLGEGAEEQYRDGYQTGYNVGVETGKTAGETTGYGNGYQDGYQEGLAHADYDSTALTIMQGIIDVGLLPVNVFLMILNFEVFGVNVSGFVSALLTISIVIIIVRFLFGGKSDGK